MKKLIALFLAFALVFLVSQAFAVNSLAAGENDFEIEFTEDGNGIIITKYNGQEKNLIIPNTIKGKPVKEINEWAIETAESIKLPDGLEEINIYAFSRDLKEITISNQNPYFSTLSGVLYNKDKTKLIAFPRARMDNNFIIPDSVKEIGGDAFAYNSYIENVKLPDGLELIGDFSFQGTGLKSILIPDAVTYIGEQAFFDAKNLDKFNIPKNVNYIESGAFLYTKWHDNQKDEFVIIGNGVLVKYNGNDEILVLPSDIKYIDDYVFSTSMYPDYPSPGKNIKEIILPDGLIEIRTSAFSDSNIKNFTLPSSLEKIGRCSFMRCKEIEKIIIPDNVTSIDREAFMSCINLKNVVLPKNIKRIEINLFDGCLQLENIVIPNSVEYIGSSSFGWCENLKYVTIPPSVKKLELCAFCSCENLKYLYIPSTVADISIHWVTENYPVILCQKDSEIEKYVRNGDPNHFPNGLEYINAQKGDLNSVGEISASDARLVLRAVAKLEALTEIQEILADVNYDGEVDAADARMILRHVAKLENIAQ